MQLQLFGKKIWVYRGAIDFRCSIDGLSSLITRELKQNPKEGVYLFYNRHRDKIKGLSWHKNGFFLFYKRMESGRFSMNFNKASGVMEVNVDEFGWLLAGLEWQKMSGWKELSYDKFS
jgi:transposase